MKDTTSNRILFNKCAHFLLYLPDDPYLVLMNIDG